MSSTTSQSYKAAVDALEAWAEQFRAAAESLLASADGVPAPLAESVRYTMLAPCKRIRPYLVVRCCQLCGGAEADAMPAALAVECVHTSSLIHDDLPAMDDDDLRRGQPSNHKVFGEAIAILAGDALLTMAFEVLATRIADPAVATAATAVLARAIGWQGMMGGQAADLLGESQPPDRKLVETIHHRKTAALFEASARLGAITARAGEDLQDALGAFGRWFGLTFQIADDLLDVTGTTERTGKGVGKDVQAGKQTYPRIVGIASSRRAGERAVQAALEQLERFGPEADDLRGLARFVLERTY